MIAAFFAGAMLALGALSVVELVSICTNKNYQNKMLKCVSLAAVRNKLRGIRPLDEDPPSPTATAAPAAPAATVQTV